MKQAIKKTLHFFLHFLFRGNKSEFEKKRTLIYPAISVKREMPLSLPGADPAFLKKVDANMRAVHLFEYSNVNLTPEGIVFKNLKIEEELFIYPWHGKRYNQVYLLSTLIKRKRIALNDNEKYLLCVDYWSNGIFHWMCDVLPRIEAVKEFARDCVLLMPSDLKYPYFHETLKAFQFKNTLVIEDNTYLHFKKLYAPRQITTSGQIRPDNILSLRRTLLNHFEPGFTGKLNYPRLYVSRNKAKYRKVLNEEAILLVLNKFGFRVIFFEDYSVMEQVELCYNASTVVSIHGANLSNTIFMKPGGNVLEFRKTGDVMNNYYYELADSVGCRYYYLDCDFHDPEPEKNIFSLYVDAEKFEALLEQIFTPRN